MCDVQSWKFWCRLCAKDDPNNINVFIKQERGVQAELVQALQKHFSVEMDEAMPKMLCTECFSFVTALVNFSEKVVKTQEVFHTLNKTTYKNLEAIRLQYNLDSEREQDFLPHTSLLEVHYFESKPKLDDFDENMFEESTEAVTNPLDQQTVMSRQRQTTVSSRERSYQVDESSNDFSKDNSDDEGLALQIHKDLSSESEFSEGNEPLSSLRTEVLKEENTLTKTKRQSRSSKNRPKRKDVPVSEENPNIKIKTEDLGESGPTLPCPECSRVFKRVQQFHQHMKRMHGITPTPMCKCPHCPDRSFSTQRKLEKHLKSHLPPELKKVVPCPHCDKKFASKSIVQTHIKHIHSNDRSFICEECGTTMRTNAALKDHMLTHTDYAPFECEVCKKKFKNQIRLKNHLEIHDPHKHVCSKCGVQLNSRATLNRHLLIHSDEMKHKCDYCGRAFKRAKALKNHLILHTGLKPYACDFCDRTFANGSNCRTHKKKAHPEELAALEASGGAKQYTKNIPKLEALKAVTKAADNLAPVVSKQSGCFAFGKKPKSDSVEEKDTEKKAAENVHPQLIYQSPQNTSTIVPVPAIDTIYSHILKQENISQKDHSSEHHSTDALDTDVHTMSEDALQLHRQQLLLQSAQSMAQTSHRGYFQFATE